MRRHAPRSLWRSGSVDGPVFTQALGVLPPLIVSRHEENRVLGAARCHTRPAVNSRDFDWRVSALGCVDGFDQDEAESKRDERAVILRRLLASKCDTLEAFELADSLFNACPCLVECFRKEGGHILGVGSIRDCRTYWRWRAASRFDLEL